MSRAHPHRSGVAVAMLVATTGACGPAAHPSSEASGPGFKLGTGLVIDAGKRRAFVMTPNKTVEALALATGEVVWETDDISVPLFVSGDALLGLDESPGMAKAALVVVDADDGGHDETCAHGDAPLGVQNGLGRRSDVVVFQADGALYLRWGWSTSYAGGVPPTGAMMAAARGAAGGMFTVAMPSCTLQPISQDEGGAANRASRRPLVVDGITITVDTVERPDGSFAAELRQQRGAQPLPAKTLATGERGRIHVGLSADGRHVAVAIFVHDPTNPRSSYSDIFDAKTGARLGRVPGMYPLSSFIVSGDTLLHAPPHRRHEGLLAVSLATGQERWRRPMRSTDYHGPYPP